MTWKFSQDGDFNLASAYYLALPEQANSFPFMGRWVWELDMLPKIKHFFWLYHHGSVLVRQVLNSRGISCNMGCPLCHRQEESIIHALRDYLVARKFSLSMGVPQALANFLRLNLLDWLKANSMCSSHIKANGMPWSVQFPFAIWYLWKHRNWTTFENTPINPKLHQAKPPLRWHKLNTDGAFLGNPGKAGGGDLIRDHQGKWIKGFMRRIGLATSITTELWALRDGLMLAKQIGITHLVVEMDAKVIVDLVQSNKAPNNSYSSLVNDCRSDNASNDHLESNCPMQL
nr:putative ribonuclease h protein [Quercus suber]